MRDPNRITQYMEQAERQALAWTVTSQSSGHYKGLIAYRHAMPIDQSLVASWPHDATSAEIADAIERLAAEIRATP